MIVQGREWLFALAVLPTVAISLHEFFHICRQRAWVAGPGWVSGGQAALPGAARGPARDWLSASPGTLLLVGPGYSGAWAFCSISNLKNYLVRLGIYLAGSFLRCFCLFLACAFALCRARWKAGWFFSCCSWWFGPKISLRMPWGVWRGAFRWPSAFPRKTVEGAVAGLAGGRPGGLGIYTLVLADR